MADLLHSRPGLQRLIRSEFLLHSALYACAVALPKLFGLITVPIYTRVFAPQQYGALDLVLTTIALASALGMLCIEHAVWRFFSDYRKKEALVPFVSTCMWTVLSSSLVLALLITVWAGSLSRQVLGTEAFAAEFRFAAWNIPLFDLFILFSVMLRFQDRAARYVRVAFSQVAVGTAAIVVLVVYCGLGLRGVIAGQMIGMLVGVGLASWSLRRWLRGVFDWNMLRRVLAYSLPLLPGIGAQWVYLYAGRLALIHYRGAAELGVYAVALQIAAIMLFLDQAFQLAWEPYFWKVYEHPGSEGMMHRAFRSSVAVPVGAAILVGLSAPEVLRLFTTPGYYRAADLIAIVALAFGFNLCRNIIGLGPTLSGKTIYANVPSYCGAAMYVALLCWLTPQAGALAVALAYALGTLCGIIIAWCITERLHPFHFPVINFLVVVLAGMGITAWIVLLHPGFWWRAVAFLALLPVVMIEGWGALRQLAQAEESPPVDQAE